MNFDDFHKAAQARGDGLLPELERLITGTNSPDGFAQSVIELHLIRRDFANASGPVPVGKVTEENDSNVLSFPNSASKSTLKKEISK